MTRGSEEKAPEQKPPEQKPPDRKTLKQKAPAGPKQKAPPQKAPARGKGHEENGDKRAQILRLRIAIVVLAFMGVVLGVLLVRDDGGDGGGEEASPASARVVSPAELSSLSASSPSPIYWAGERPNTELELTEEESDFYLRYLEGGAKPDAEVLTVGTYLLDDPRASLEEVAASPTAIVRHAADGREVVTSEENPNSVYFVTPDNSAQIEVYDPSAKAAMDLALSGNVRPVD
jgi:hypothetical protein